MTLTELERKFPTEEKCRLYLEKLRWGKKPVCPYCTSGQTKPLKNEPRHHCNHCKRNFSVMVDTIFQDTRMPLKTWFRLFTLILNAKKGISAKQLQRDLGVSYKTAWMGAMKGRCAMIDPCIELQNIVEMDESYVGGKPRKGVIPKDNTPMLFKVETKSFVNKRGRGTTKAPVVGIVERGGNVVLKVVEKVDSRTLIAMLRENINEGNTIVMTDEFPAYKKFDDIVQHLTINHKKTFSDGIVHTNTIEGFWAIIKNSIRGQYVALSKKYLPFYLVQAQYIYNRRNAKHELLEEFLKLAMRRESSMENYKPTGDVKKIVYPPKQKVRCL